MPETATRMPVAKRDRAVLACRSLHGAERFSPCQSSTSCIAPSAFAFPPLDRLTQSRNDIVCRRPTDLIIQTARVSKDQRRIVRPGGDRSKPDEIGLSHEFGDSRDDLLDRNRAAR